MDGQAAVAQSVEQPVLATSAGNDAGSKPASGAVLQLVLAWPPSVNHYYGDRVIKPSGGARAFVSKYVTERGKEYQADVAQRCNMPAIKDWAGRHFGKPISLLVACYPPGKRERDIGNLDKALLDSLKNAGVLRNDFDVWDQRYFRACLSSPPGRVVVRLQAFDLSGLGS